MVGLRQQRMRTFPVNLLSWDVWDFARPVPQTKCGPVLLKKKRAAKFVLDAWLHGLDLSHRLGRLH